MKLLERYEPLITDYSSRSVKFLKKRIMQLRLQDEGTDAFNDNRAVLKGGILEDIAEEPDLILPDRYAKSLDDILPEVLEELDVKGIIWRGRDLLVDYDGETVPHNESFSVDKFTGFKHVVSTDAREDVYKNMAQNPHLAGMTLLRIYRHEDGSLTYRTTVDGHDTFYRIEDGMEKEKLSYEMGQKLKVQPDKLYSKMYLKGSDPELLDYAKTLVGGSGKLAYVTSKAIPDVVRANQAGFVTIQLYPFVPLRSTPAVVKTLRENEDKIIRAVLQNEAMKMMYL